MSYYLKNDRLTNEHGDGLRNFRVRVLDSSGVVQPIYADTGGSPIATVSGVTNAALVDELGNWALYCSPGIYTLEYRDPAEQFYYSRPDIAIGLEGVNPDDLAAVAGIAPNLSDIAANFAAVTTVANDLNAVPSNTKTVATNILAVTTAANNMPAIIAAPGQASAAASSATLAGHYANDSTDTDVPGGSAGSRGAKFWALQSASSAAIATAQAGIATTAATAAQGYALATASDRAFVASVAADAGALATYSTKAAAVADLANIGANKYVKVLADETFGYAETRYQKQGSSLVLVAPIQYKGKTVYLADAVSGGSDLNDGLSEATPKLTKAAALAMVATGDTILVKAGSRLPAPFVVPDKTRAGKYGAGPDPIWDASRAIPQASWVDAGDGTLYADVVQEVTTIALGTGQNTTWRPRMFMESTTLQEQGRVLNPYWSGASVAANIAYLAANPTTTVGQKTTLLFTVYNTATGGKDPRVSGQAGTNFRYVVPKVTGFNPALGDITLYYVECQGCLQLGDSSEVRDMVFQRSGIKDACGKISGTGTLSLVERVHIRDVASHGWVGGPVSIRNSRAYAVTPGGDTAAPVGNGWEMYNGVQDIGCKVENCHAEGFLTGFFSHGNGDARNVTHAIVNIRNCTSKGNNTAIGGENSLYGWHVNGFRSIDDNAFYAAFGGTIRNVLHIQAATSTGTALALYSATYVENATFILASGGFIAANNYAQSFDNTRLVDLYLKNVTKVGGTFNTSANFKKINYYLDSCVMGETVTSYPSSAWPWSSMTAVNSQLQCWTLSIEDMIAGAGVLPANPGIATSCTSPWRTQTWTHTCAAAEFSFIASGFLIAANNAADKTQLTANASNVVSPGGTIRILLYDGTNNFDTVVTAVSGTAVTVSPAVPATFSNKSFQYAYLPKKLWFADTIGTPSTAGDQLYLADASSVSVGTWLYLGALTNSRRDPYGPRKITAVSGNTVTLDRPISWKRNPSTITYKAIDGTGVGVTRPTIPVGFHFSLRGVENATHPFRGTSITIVHPTALALANRTAEENGGSGGAARFTQNVPTGPGLTQLYLSDGTSGTYGQIRHELGYLDVAVMPVADTSVVTITDAIYIDEHAVLFEGEPRSSGRADLLRGSYVASLNIGSRGIETLLQAA